MKAELQRLDPLPEDMIDDARYELLAPPMSNLILYTDYEVDDVVKAEYDSVPSVALHVIETLIITGMAKSMRKMQLSIFAETGEMLTPEIINYHGSLNKPKLEKQRDSFLERQRRAMWTQLLELAEQPNGVRYQRMVTDMAIAVERDIAALAETPCIAGYKTLNGMVDSIKRLMETDPLYTKMVRKEDRKVRRQRDRQVVENRVDDTLAHLANFEETENEHTDFSELEAYTSEIVERSGGGENVEFRAEPENSGTGEEGQEHEAGEGSCSESA